MTMKIKKVCCDLCGGDITRAMKFYDRFGCRYCYECNEFLKGKYRKGGKNDNSDNTRDPERDHLQSDNKRLRRGKR